MKIHKIAQNLTPPDPSHHEQVLMDEEKIRDLEKMMEECSKCIVTKDGETIHCESCEGIQQEMDGLKEDVSAYYSHYQPN